MLWESPDSDADHRVAWMWFTYAPHTDCHVEADLVTQYQSFFRRTEIIASEYLAPEMDLG